MNDPWDVKSKRKSGQYVSCMKINGVPLLPPVLSKECREEMQYYKLLAREVNKRLTGLHSYIHDAGSSSDCEPGSIEHIEHGQTHSPRSIEARPLTSVPSPTREKSLSNFVSSNSPVNDTSRSSPSPKVYIDVNVSFNKTLCNEVKIISPPPKDIPERDYNSHKSKKNTPKCQLNKNATQIETKKKGKKIENKDKNCIDSSRMLQDRPSAHGIKSFTGSLNDLHSESIKDSEITSGSLVRQSSYTLLQPSPHLLAHLENQSLSTGVEITSISMSESCSNINTFNKKRRSWDLESAKATWSNMALELSLKKNVSNVYGTIGNKNKNHNSRSYSCQRSQPIASSPSKNTISNPCNKFKPKVSPVKKNINLCLTKPSQPCVANDKTQPIHVSASENIDPALKIRELYEKVQKQQLVQMASLVEKQKKEQMLLQQVFEEQNKLLFKQLKTICPKSPIEIKEAWVDQEIEDRGPVSLSQVINYKSPGSNTLTSPQANYPLTDVYLDRRNNGTNKSEEKIESLKKQQIRTNNQNTNKRINDRTCTSSPVTRTSLASRKLNYDTSDSTDREYEPILTDRTNDTMADLNVTFPSDHSDEYNASVIQTKRPLNQQCAKDNSKHNGGSHHSTSNSRVTETPTHNTARFPYKTTRTPRELEAATKIVAHVKGYLVRRLMRTDRVQGIVQTIKDALLCALQLHQDREGIRGADVDLHRRLIQQITAACYSLHDTFVASSPAERCAMISADRDKRRRSVSSRQSNNSFRQTDIMSQSHSGSFPARAKRQQPSLMTQSNYETFSNGDKSSPVSRRYMSSPRRRPWR